METLPRMRSYAPVGYAFLIGLIVLSSCKEEDEKPLGPIIESFTPSEGLAGITEVIITGEHFSPVSSENVVKFGSSDAAVTTATTNSLTVIVPFGAVTGKISVAVGSLTATSATDFVVLPPPKNFFTVHVDASIQTSTGETWILATNSEGDWIDAQQYGNGPETRVLRGYLDEHTFTLHFLNITHTSQGLQVAIKSFGGIPANFTWSLSRADKTSPKTHELSVHVTNYQEERPHPNDNVVVTSSVGTIGPATTSSSNGTYNAAYNVRQSPTDVLVTLYKDGDPYYAKFNNVILPASISVDAETDMTRADRTFTMRLPQNDFYSVKIDARRNGYPDFVRLSDFTDPNGGTSVKLGYDFGYFSYSTRVVYKSGRKKFEYASFGLAEVDEQPKFPSFNFDVTKSAASDFSAKSDLTFDLSFIEFDYAKDGVFLHWEVIQPRAILNPLINFKVKQFPSELSENFPGLPSVNGISYSRVTGYEYTDLFTYTDRLLEFAQSGAESIDLTSPNYYSFQLSAE